MSMSPNIVQATLSFWAGLMNCEGILSESRVASSPRLFDRGADYAERFSVTVRCLQAGIEVQHKGQDVIQH